MKSPKFKKVADKIYLSEFDLTVKDIDGYAKKAHVVLRIDGRGGQYRIDKADPVFNVWEAIDSPVSGPNKKIRSLAKAKKYADLWYDRAKSKMTSSPHISYEEGQEFAIKHQDRPSKRSKTRRSH